MAQEMQLINEEMLGRKDGRQASRLVMLYRVHEAKIIGFVSVLGVLAAWEYVGAREIVNPMFTSSPSLIWKAGQKMFAEGRIWNDMYVSLQEFTLGFGLSILLGIPLGILTGWYRRLNYALDPFISALYATPRIAMLPLLIIWLGIGIESKVAVVFLGAVFPILMSTHVGVRTLDESLLKASRSFGANDRQIFVTIALPGSVPFIITGLRLGVGRALIGVLVGELYAATAGIGYLISVFGNTFQTDKVFVGVLIVCAFGMILMELLKRLETKFDAWRPPRV